MSPKFNLLHKWLIRQHARSTQRLVGKFSPGHSANLSTSDQGFALPLAVGMGLIMIVVGMTMIVRSQNDQVTASLQKQTSQGLAIAEGGTARILGLLNDNYHPLLRRSYDPSGRLGSNSIDEWSSLSDAPPCFSTATLGDDLLTGRISSDNSSTPTNYTLLAYRYDDPDGAPDSGDETGTLLVRGEDLDSDSVSVIEQSFKIDEATGSANFPGLLATNINLGNNDVLGAVAGNVACTDPANCPVSQCVDGEPTEQGLRDAIGAKNNGVVQGEIRVGNTEWPPLPTAPSGATNLGDIGGSMTLPNGGTLIDDAYHYIVGNINLTGSNTLTINTSPTARVYLYVTGNISMGGSTAITHSGLASDFRIYGNPADSNDSNDQTFTLNGGANTTNVFIYAPDATVGINGGSSNPDLSGAVWAKEWNGSSSNNAEISVPANMGELLGSSLKTTIQSSSTSAATSWQQRPAQ